MIEQAKFIYYPLGKAFEKQVKTIEKQIKAIREHATQPAEINVLDKIYDFDTYGCKKNSLLFLGQKNRKI